MPEQGVAYYAPIVTSLPDDQTASSKLLLYEDDTLLERTVNHALVRQTGRGYYSHWGDRLFFTSSDNSDPRSNGRRYSVVPGGGQRQLKAEAEEQAMHFASSPQTERSQRLWLAIAIMTSGLLLLSSRESPHGAPQTRPPADQGEPGQGLMTWAGRSAIALTVAAAWLPTVIDEDTSLLALDPTALWREQGSCSIAVLQPNMPNDRTGSSTLKLFEDGRELEAHANLETIREGTGSFSHWGDYLYFSASDGSDPATNGRQYSVSLPGNGTLPSALTAGVHAMMLLLGLFFLRAGGANAPTGRNGRPRWRRPLQTGTGLRVAGLAVAASVSLLAYLVSNQAWVTNTDVQAHGQADVLRAAFSGLHKDLAFTPETMPPLAAAASGPDAAAGSALIADQKAAQTTPPLLPALVRLVDGPGLSEEAAFLRGRALSSGLYLLLLFGLFAVVTRSLPPGIAVVITLLTGFTSWLSVAGQVNSRLLAAWAMLTAALLLGETLGRRSLLVAAAAGVALVLVLGAGGSVAPLLWPFVVAAGWQVLSRAAVSRPSATGPVRSPLSAALPGAVVILVLVSLPPLLGIGPAWSVQGPLATQVLESQQPLSGALTQAMLFLAAAAGTILLSPTHFIAWLHRHRLVVAYTLTILGWSWGLSSGRIAGPDAAIYKLVVGPALLIASALLVDQGRKWEPVVAVGSRLLSPTSLLGAISLGLLATTLRGVLTLGT